MIFWVGSMEVKYQTSKTKKSKKMVRMRNQSNQNNNPRTHKAFAQNKRASTTHIHTLLTYRGSHPHQTGHIGSHGRGSRNATTQSTGGRLVHNVVKGGRRWIIAIIAGGGSRGRHDGKEMLCWSEVKKEVWNQKKQCR